MKGFPDKIFGTFQLVFLRRTLHQRRLKAVHRVETAEQGAGLRALLGCLVLEVRDVLKITNFKVTIWW